MMTEAAHLSDALMGMLISSDHGWFTSFPHIVAGLSAQQAACIPLPAVNQPEGEGSTPVGKFNSIWAVVNHMAFWQEYALLHIKGIEIDNSFWKTDGWPPIINPGDEHAWEAAKERLVVKNQELATFITLSQDETLDEPVFPGKAKRYQVLHGLIAQNSYHICEIISIRHMLGWWLERT